MATLDSKGQAISNRLRLAREQAGLSQGQVARMLNMHRPSISEIEAGRRKVSAEELAEFARIYDVSLSWLAEGESDDNEQLRARIEMAARKIAKLRKEDLDQLLDLLSTLKTQDDTNM
jgi:transcriptional regulator with XRE-family HTH domain